MRLLKLFAILILFCEILVTLVGCSTSSGDQKKPLNLEERWSHKALAEDTIHVLTHSTNELFAGTSQGVFSQKLSAPENNTWRARGLENKHIIDVVILGNQKILAGVKLSNIESKQNSLFLTTNGGVEWMPYQQNFGGKNQYSWLTALCRHPHNPSILYAKAGAMTVAKSTDMGENWQLIYGSWEPQLGFSLFLTIDTHNPDILWSGGASPSFVPTIIKSTDGGNTWQKLSIYGGGANVNDVAIHPSQSNTIIAGLAGITANMIRKSTDGGQSWTTTLEGVGVRTLAHSARNPEIVYASGINENGTLFFAKSPDFGESWETVEWEESPAGVQVNDMVSVMEDGGEVLYLGTNQGVFSYMFKE